MMMHEWAYASIRRYPCWKEGGAGRVQIQSSRVMQTAPRTAFADTYSKSPLERRRSASEAKSDDMNYWKLRNRTIERSESPNGDRETTWTERTTIYRNGLGNGQIREPRGEQKRKSTQEMDLTVRKLVDKRRKRRAEIVTTLLHVIKQQQKIETRFALSVMMRTENGISDREGVLRSRVGH